MIVKRRLLIAAVLLLVVLSGVRAVAEDGHLRQGFGGQAQEHFRKGHRFYLESKPTEAEAEFKESLRLNPKLSDGHYYLGSIYFKQTRYNEAIKHCEQALKINPEDLKSLIILGLSWQHSGLNGRAIETLQKARAIDGRSAAVHSALGLVYCAKGDLAKAKEEYGILKQIDSELAKDLWQKIEEQENKRPAE